MDSKRWLIRVTPKGELHPVKVCVTVAIVWLAASSGSFARTLTGPVRVLVNGRICVAVRLESARPKPGLDADFVQRNFRRTLERRLAALKTEEVQTTSGPRSRVVPLEEPYACKPYRGDLPVRLLVTLDPGGAGYRIALTVFDQRNSGMKVIDRPDAVNWGRGQASLIDPPGPNFDSKAFALQAALRRDVGDLGDELGRLIEIQRGGSRNERGFD